MTFLTQPQDATVVEGGDATFQCAAEENGMALQFGWDFIPKGGMLTTVVTGTPVGGGVDGNGQWRPYAANFEWGAARGGRGDSGVHCTCVHFSC